MYSRASLRLLILLILAIVLVGSCANHSLVQRIEVKGDATVEEKVAFASSLITRTRYDRLRLQLR